MLNSCAPCSKSCFFHACTWLGETSYFLHISFNVVSFFNACNAISNLAADDHFFYFLTYFTSKLEAIISQILEFGGLNFVGRYSMKF